MSAKRDYYEILGLSKSASVDEIKSAYRKLAMQFHPDRNKDAGAEEKFKEISEAYAALSDPEKRKIYDQHGHSGFDQRFSQEDIFRNADFSDFSDLFRSMGFSFGGADSDDSPFGSMFSSMFGASSQKGRSLSADVNISLKEAAKGTTRSLNFRRNGPCDTCKGTGSAPGSGMRNCSKCGGHGQVQVIRNLGGFGRISTVSPCPNCKGRGQVPGKPCDSCSGKGYQQKDEKIEVQVPAGIEDGMRLSLHSLGEWGPDGPGDLFVRVRVENDSRFTRDGDDLYFEKQVSFATAVLGGDVNVPTLESENEVHVPAGTQSHTLLRLRGEGMPRLRGKGRGDLIVRIIIEVPKPGDLSEEQKELLIRFDNEEDSGSSSGPDKDKSTKKKKSWFSWF